MKKTPFEMSHDELVRDGSASARAEIARRAEKRHKPTKVSSTKKTKKASDPKVLERMDALLAVQLTAKKGKAAYEKARERYLKQYAAANPGFRKFLKKLKRR